MAKKSLKDFVGEDTIIEISLTEHATVNIGNYESSKISFGLTIPAKAKDVNKVRKAMEDYISKYIEDRVMEIKNEIGY